jgi:hypothetical protein
MHGACPRFHNGDDIARAKRHATGCHDAVALIDADIARAGDAGFAHAARHDGGMRCATPARGDDAGRGVHAVNVFGTCFDAHENDALAFARQTLGFRGREDDLAPGRAGRSRKTAGHDAALVIRIDGRMQKLVQHQRWNIEQRLFARLPAGRDVLNGDAERRAGAAFRLDGARNGLHPAGGPRGAVIAAGFGSHVL